MKPGPPNPDLKIVIEPSDQSLLAAAECPNCCPKNASDLGISNANSEARTHSGPYKHRCAKDHV